MYKRLALTLVLALWLPALLAAKGRTLKITVATAGQTPAIEIRNPSVGQFHIWAGPGTFVNHVPQMEGFIADWAKGAIHQRPAGLTTYRVSFYTGCLAEEHGCESPGERLSYIVHYEYDATAGKGYVYLPGKADGEYRLNARSVLRGLEGNWSPATTAWQEYVAPVVAKHAK